MTSRSLANKSYKDKLIVNRLQLRLIVSDNSHILFIKLNKSLNQKLQKKNKFKDNNFCIL